MVIKGDSLKYLENLKIDMKKVFLSGIAGSIGVKYVGESDTLAGAFEYFTLSQSTYNCLRKDFQLASISTITKLTSKVKKVVLPFLVH